MNYIKQSILGLCILCSFHLCAQNTSSMLDELESELFPLESEQIYLYELIACKNHQIDSSILVRKRQPKAVKVLELLEQIMHTRKSDEIERLQSIYDRHIENFMKEWAKAYKANYYACDPIMNQYTILSGFEEVLTSLSFRKNNFMISEVFNFYINEKHLNRKMLDNVLERCELIKAYNDFSNKYRSLNPCRYFKGRISFHYLDPYIEELKPYFVEYLYECDWSESLHPDDCMIIKSSMRFYNRIKEKRIIDYMIENYAVWHANHKSAFIWTYASQQYDKRLSKFLVDWWIEEESKPEMNPNYQRGWIGLLISHGNNWDVVLESIIELGKVDFEKTIKVIKYLPRKDALVRLEDFELTSDNNSLLQELMKVLKPMNKEK